MLAGVRNLKDIADLKSPVFGNKANNLSKAIHCGIPVLPGFCITFELCQEYSVQLMQFYIDLVREYQVLCAQDRDGTPALIVRSSCEMEDTEYLLFPGVFKSVHDVKGFDALLDAIGVCYDSIHMPAVEQYMSLHENQHEIHYFTVLVQMEQYSDYAGVASSFVPLYDQEDNKIMLVQLTQGSNRTLVRGGGPFNSYTIFKKSSAEIVYRQARRQIAIDTETENVLFAKLHKIIKVLMDVFGTRIGIEWGSCRDEMYIFQVRTIQYHMEACENQRDIIFFQNSCEQGLKYQAMRYFYEQGLFPSKVLFFEKHTEFHEILKGVQELDKNRPVTVRFSSKREIGLPRYFAQCGEEALKFIRDTVQEDWAMVLYNSINVRDSYELYLDARRMILEHIPGMWESDSKLFADTIYVNDGQLDFWLAQEERLAKLEDEQGIVWKMTAPLSQGDAYELAERLFPIAKKLREDFSADLPLNFHFVGDQNNYYFLNCRLSARISNKIDIPEHLYHVASIDDMRRWDGHSSIMFEPDLERGEEVFLTEYIPFLKEVRVPIFVKFGILSHPAIMLREFGIETQPLFLHHTHYSWKKEER